MAGDPVMGSGKQSRKISQHRCGRFCKGVHHPISTPHRM